MRSAGDHALRIEHVEGVVGHALDQQPEALFALAQCFLVHAPLAQVARDLGEAEQLARFVAQGGDHDVRPEARAVLLHPPALILEAPLGGGDLQLVLRPATFQSFAGIEDREVAADDLFGRVPLDPLRAEVPGHDPSLGVEEEHGVILRLLDDELEDVRRDR
jgi:hypothetical protein